MPISLNDFEPDQGTQPSAQSKGFDSSRPFLFEGLEPKYATKVVHSTFIPMRDGVRLSTDFHIPIGAELPLPVVLQRTPYNKRRQSTALPHILAEQGFVVAEQDVRGRHESEGAFEACTGQDREDGYDTVSWLAAQPWCNGAVGAIGSSYSAETAAKLAAMRHPNHRCGVVMFDGAYAGGNSQNGAFLQGGITILRLLVEWFRHYVPAVSYGPPPHVDREAWFSSAFAQAYSTQPVNLPPVDIEALVRTLPVHDMLERSGAAPSAFSEMMLRSANPADPYWRALGFLTDDDRFNTPTIHMTGPLERGGTGFDNFQLFRRNAESDVARDNQYLWFTPAQHSGYAHCAEDSAIGVRRFGDTRYPYYRDLVAWFGHWLRGDELDLEHWPKVRYYVGNRNQWSQAPDWPAPGVAIQKAFLHGEGRANSRLGDGRLSFEPPEKDEPADRFVYDPANPVPSQPDLDALDPLGGGYANRSSLELRADILVYTSDPLDKPVTLAGPVEAVLHVSSSAPDTDFSVVLSEVDGEGRSINVSTGMARARYRDGLDQPTMMKQDEVYTVKVDLWHVSMEIPSGHRLRVAISSSHFPFYDRNLNTGGNNYTDTQMVIAENWVHHSKAFPSAVLLPIMPNQ